MGIWLGPAQFMYNRLLKYRINKLIKLAVLGFTLFTFLIIPFDPPSSAHACTQPVGGHPPFIISERVHSSEAVFLGKVVNIYEYPPVQPPNLPNPNPFIYYAEIEVSHFFKGNGKETVTMSTFGPSSICLQGVTIGQSYIFFGNRHHNEAQIDYQANYQNSVRAIAEPSQDNIQEVLNVINNKFLHDTYLPIVSNSSMTDEVGKINTEIHIGKFIISKLNFLKK